MDKIGSDMAPVISIGVVFDTIRYQKEEFEMMTKQAELKKQAYESTLKSRALSVLIYLIDRSNKELTCFPAIPTMAKHLHISISTVKRALHELENSGYIEKEARFRDKNKGQTSNLYTLVLFERCQISNDGEHQELKKPEEYGEAMEVATVEVPQENQSDRKQHRAEHISFDMIKAWKEENGGRPESEPPQVPNINVCHKECLEKNRGKRAVGVLNRIAMRPISSQDAGHFYLQKKRFGNDTFAVIPVDGGGGQPGTPLNDPT